MLIKENKVNRHFIEQANLHPTGKAGAALFENYDFHYDNKLS
jgi:hypothetical protein